MGSQPSCGLKGRVNGPSTAHLLERIALKRSRILDYGPGRGFYWRYVTLVKSVKLALVDMGGEFGDSWYYLFRSSFCARSCRTPSNSFLKFTSYPHSQSAALNQIWNSGYYRIWQGCRWVVMVCGQRAWSDGDSEVVEVWHQITSQNLAITHKIPQSAALNRILWSQDLTSTWVMMTEDLVRDQLGLRRSQTEILEGFLECFVLGDFGGRLITVFIWDWLLNWYFTLAGEGFNCTLVRYIQKFLSAYHTV